MISAAVMCAIACGCIYTYYVSYERAVSVHAPMRQYPRCSFLFRYMGVVCVCVCMVTKSLLGIWLLYAWNFFYNVNMFYRWHIFGTQLYGEHVLYISMMYCISLQWNFILYLLVYFSLVY